MENKILFWLDSDFFDFVLAYYLQEKTNADFYAIIAITNKTKNFFKTQKLVNFKETWFYFDHTTKRQTKPDHNYLSAFEKKYDLNLWELATNERIFHRFNRFYKFSTEEILLILEQECRLFEKILDNVKPNFFITKETNQHKDEILYRMCKKIGVKVLMLSQPNVGYKCVISSEPRKFDSTKKLDDIKNNGRSFEEMQNWLHSFSGYEQLKTLSNKFATSRYAKFKAAMNFLTSDNSNAKTHYTYYGRTKPRVIIHEVKSSLNKRSRQQFMNKNFLTELNYDEKFVYFPLAVDEERSLLIGAPYYTNQLENIRHIVKSLPIDYKLYVKETPSQVTRHWRPISEYKDMMAVPNVRLLHPSVLPREIYKKTSLVITIAGSASLEAAFYKKPSIVFAEHAYSMLPSVHTIKSFDELPKAIRMSLNKKVNEADLDRYISLFDEHSFEFDQHGFHTMEHDYFFFGGHLIDVDVSDSKMEYFLQANKSEFEKVTNAFIKKLQ